MTHPSPPSSASASHNKVLDFSIGFLGGLVLVIVWSFVSMAEMPHLPRWGIYLIHLVINCIFFLPLLFGSEIAKKKGRKFIRIGILSAFIFNLIVGASGTILAELGYFSQSF
ncbi:MAG: hypothetical protein PHZ00_00430 [Candidatus Peribacteraceae bacterium]|nr:hypothetical protein [Candidatus Peribacteraceae bacterium]